MVFTTAMETSNGLHYCYGDQEWLTLLLWRRGMVLTILWRQGSFSLMLWRQGMVFTIVMGTRNGFYCFMERKSIFLCCSGENRRFEIFLWGQEKGFPTSM